MIAAGREAPRVIVAPGPDGVAAIAAALVLEAQLDAVEKRGRFFIALAGGSTPRRLYEALAQVRGARFDAWNVFFGDERWVPADDRNSNARMAREALLDRVAIPPRQVHPVPTGYGAPREAARLYALEIRRVLAPPPTRMPQFDVVLLGVGRDGHTASLFPGSSALAARAGDLVVATWAPGPRAWRVTMTASAIAAARRVVFVVTGEDKAEAVARSLYPDTGEPVPASQIRPVDGEAIWVLDPAAARQVRTLDAPTPAGSMPLRLLSFD